MLQFKVILRNKIPILILIGVISYMCSNDKDVEIQTICDFVTLVDTQEYNNAQDDHVTINSFNRTGDCLQINFSASGCDGESWEVTLIDAGIILESYPPQRNIRLHLKNKERCLAYFTKEYSFDLTPLRVDGNQVQLNFAKADKNIQYTY